MDRSGISEETLRDQFSRALTQTHAEILLSGSVAELPLAYVSKNITDIDVMDIPTDIVALEIDDYLAHQGREQPVVIINSDNRPGLVYLVSPYKGDLICKYKTQIVTDFRKGPSWKRAFFLDSTIASAMKINLALFEAISDFSEDRVFSIKCPKWPNSAKEWITRQRLNGWPSDSLIRDIENQGCHFVAKPEFWKLWRYSFSRA